MMILKKKLGIFYIQNLMKEKIKLDLDCLNFEKQCYLLDQQTF